jgi:hypothetical protein
MYYTRSIDLLPRAALYTNRAIVNLKLQRYDEAEQDASSALKLIDSLTPSLELKAYLRRGTAYMKRGLYKTAIMDFDSANRVSVQKMAAGESKESMKMRAECVKKLKELEPAPMAERKTRFKVEEVEEDEIELVLPKSGAKTASKRPIIEVISEERTTDDDNEGIEEIITEATMSARNSRTEVMKEVSTTRTKDKAPMMKEVSTRSIVEEPVMKEVSSRSIIEEPLMMKEDIGVEQSVKETSDSTIISEISEDLEAFVTKEEVFKNMDVPNLGGAIDTLAVCYPIITYN